MKKFGVCFADEFIGFCKMPISAFYILTRLCLAFIFLLQLNFYLTINNMYIIILSTDIFTKGNLSLAFLF